MSGVESKKRAEEKREAASARRREIREKELKGERLAFIELVVLPCEPGPNISPSFLPIPFTMSGVKENLQYFKRLSEDEWTQKEREAAAAKRREIMELKQEHRKRRQLLSSHVPRPQLIISSSLDFSPLKEEAVSPAPSCVSMKSDRSMGLPVSSKRYKFSPEKMRSGSPASSCESMKSARSMDPPLSFKRQKTGSPAPSCLSMKSDMSRESPPYFSGEPLPSDTKDPGINAGHWRELNSMVSHVQNELDKLKRFMRAINPEGQGEYEEGVKCEGESAEKRQQGGISEDHTGHPEKN